MLHREVFQALGILVVVVIGVAVYNMYKELNDRNS